MPATVAAFGELRPLVADWLSSVGASPSEARDLELAISELTANVVEHAYADAAVGELRLSVALDSHGVVHAEVSDDGAWLERASRSPTRGRGLWLAGQMVDELRVSRGVGGPGRAGTVVAVHRQLSRDGATGRDSG